MVFIPDRDVRGRPRLPFIDLYARSKELGLLLGVLFRCGAPTALTLTRPDGVGLMTAIDGGDASATADGLARAAGIW